jgi:hypothetical protein
MEEATLPLVLQRQQLANALARYHSEGLKKRAKQAGVLVNLLSNSA